MEQAAEEVVETEQAAEEVVATAAAGAKVADLLASKGVTISPAILSLGADVVLQQYLLRSIDGFPDFSQHLSIFPLSA
jgi:sulfur carrier protein ThiS